MYDNFYYAELLILIPLLISGFFLFVALKSTVDNVGKFFGTVFSILFGAIFLLILLMSGAIRPNSPDTAQVVEFLRKADENDVDVTYFDMYSKIKYKGKTIFPYAVRRPVIKYLEQQEQDEVNELIKEVIFD